MKFSEDNRIPAYVAVQDLYNFVDRRSYEGKISEAVADLGISNIPFCGIAKGFLTSKYCPGVAEVYSKHAAGVREYATDKNYAVQAVMEKVAKNHNVSLSAIALAWLRAQTTVSVPISSARTVEQVEEIIQIVELSGDKVKKLKRIQTQNEYFCIIQLTYTHSINIY
jgi:aryl-alcohol dehydrogenase-like predicted oxidoreductase